MDMQPCTVGRSSSNRARLMVAQFKKKDGQKMSIQLDNSVNGVQPRGEKVQAMSLTTILKEFRMMVEGETGVKIEKMEVNAAVWLDDIARFIGLGDKRRREVMGITASRFVDDVNNGRVRSIQ